MGLTVHSVGRHAAILRSAKATEQSVRIIALAGNPNVGKSTVFNGLTGMKQHTGNWPGKTVSTAQGSCKHGDQQYLLIDLPGTYSLDARSAEEAVARDLLQSGAADAAIIVCDATCLERNLILVLQILEIVPRALVCLNLMDEAVRKHLHIDIDALSHALGVPVVGTTARDAKSLCSLLDALDDLFKHPIQKINSTGSTSATAKSRIETAHRIASAVVKSDTAVPNQFDRKIDRILTGHRYGYPLMLLLLLGVLFLTVHGANIPSAILSSLLFRVGDFLSAFLHYIHIPPLLHDALILGIYRTLAWVVAVMLPPMAIFFPLFTLLEDIGYLPRIAYNLDKPFQRCHACGKQALTMCVVNEGMPLFFSHSTLVFHPEKC